MNGRAQYDKPFLFNTCKKDHSRTFDMEVKRLITIIGKQMPRESGLHRNATVSSTTQ